jgi:hypothetical protein
VALVCVAATEAAEVRPPPAGTQYGSRDRAEARDGKISVIGRSRNLSKPGDAAYLYEIC